MQEKKQWQYNHVISMSLKVAAHVNSNYSTLFFG